MMLEQPQNVQGVFVWDAAVLKFSLDSYSKTVVNETLQAHIAESDDVLHLRDEDFSSIDTTCKATQERMQRRVQAAIGLAYVLNTYLVDYGVLSHKEIADTVAATWNVAPHNVRDTLLREEIPPDRYEDAKQSISQSFPNHRVSGTVVGADDQQLSKSDLRGLLVGSCVRITSFYNSSEVTSYFGRSLVQYVDEGAARGYVQKHFLKSKR